MFRSCLCTSDQEDCHNISDSPVPVASDQEDCLNILDSPAYVAEVQDSCHDFLDRQSSHECSDVSEESDEELTEEGSIIFPQCPLSLNASILLVKKFQMRHKLTQVAVSDLLQLMKLHFPSPNNFPSSLFLFNKQLPVLRDPVEYNFFCSRCLGELPDKDCTLCPNAACNQNLSDIGAVSSFIELPLEPQLTTILESMLISLIPMTILKLRMPMTYL